MQLMRIRKYKTDIHKLGKKYGNLPKNEFIGNNFGYFSAGYQMKDNYISNIKILIGNITKLKL